jgi:hypothetical protein
MGGNDRQGPDTTPLCTQACNLLGSWTKPRLYARTGWYGARVRRTTLRSRTAVGNGGYIRVSDQHWVGPLTCPVPVALPMSRCPITSPETCRDRIGAKVARRFGQPDMGPSATALLSPTWFSVLLRARHAPGKGHCLRVSRSSGGTRKHPRGPIWRMKYRKGKVETQIHS